VISIVLPVFDEEENIVEVYEALTDQLVSLGEPYEIVFVDDGSRDGSLERIRELSIRDSNVKGVSLSRNFGHQIAISAGLEYASGDATIVMDADLQHPPDLIPQMIARWREGFDVVYTIREGRDHAGPLKRWSAALYYRLMNRMSDIEITSNTPDFRLMDRRVVEALRQMPERTRFLRGLVRWVGFRQTALRFVAAPRTHGKTKFPLSKMLRFSVDGVTAFSTVPLRLASYVGLFAAVSSIPYALWAIYLRLFTNEAVHGWASVVVAVLFLGGVQLISIGIMGEYLGRVYEEAKGRPLYLTREVIGEIGALSSSRQHPWREREAMAVAIAPGLKRSGLRGGDSRR
jgi:glycosyltransferase involved in cell wall biosynthesis